jgi:hypothetical protein
MKAVYKQFIREAANSKDNSKETEPSDRIDTDQDTFFSNFFFNDEKQPLNNESALFRLDNELEVEIKMFSIIFDEAREFDRIKQSVDFWKNRHGLKRLANLFKILNTIHISSACIERFFSITGIICNQRSMNMKADLIINRGKTAISSQNIEVL